MIVGAIVGLLYGFILAVLSIAAAGGGHGTPIPLWLSSAPFGLVAPPIGDAALLLGPLLVWAALGFLAALPKMLGLTLLLLLLQYVAGITLVVTTGAVLADLARDAWVTLYVTVWATVYLVGQVVLWWRIVKRSPD